MSLGFKIRDPKPQDLNFITSTFLKSMKKESPLGRQCSVRVFYKEFTEVIDYILSVSKTLVACTLQDDDVILGYLIFEPHVIHYCFTKHAFRGLGIAKGLISHALPESKILTFSQNTNSAKRITENHEEMIFNPFTLYKRGA